jgi:hypothetical protein
MTGRLGTGIAVALALIAGTAAYGATTGTDSRSELAVGFSTAAPARVTGVSFHVLYKQPEDPAAKPPPLTSATFALPLGSTIDNTAVPQCEATDDEFQARGRDACPAASKVGEGTLAVMTGSPTDPTEFDSTAFNGKGEIVELVTVKGTNTTAGLDRLKIEGSTLTANPPALPGGPPDGRTAVREIKLTLAARADARRPYVTSPGLCVPAEGWRSRGTFAFADGGTSTVVSSTPCTPAALAPRSGRRAIRAGVRTSLAVKVDAASPECTRGALLILGRYRAHTDDTGAARIRATLYRPGHRTLRAVKPGCAPGKLGLRVRR